MLRKPLLFLLPLTLFLLGCPGTDEPGTDPFDTFDRGALLEGWVDYFGTAYAEFEVELTDFDNRTQAYFNTPSGPGLIALQESFTRTYTAWQRLSPVLTGEAERLRLRARINTYPTDVDLIRENSSTGDFNLELPSNTAAQGFPALEYLLFAQTSNGTSSIDPTHPDVAANRAYFRALVITISSLTVEAAEEWRGASAEAYIANDGNSATASIDRTVNDFLFYYERNLRAGKVGIPAGVFSDDPLPELVESVYQGQSRDYLLAALRASEDFFTNHGLADYLDALDVVRDGQPLSQTISEQFVTAGRLAEGYENDFEEIVRTDNVRMLELYDALQRNVIFLKVDMLQALNINVDYVDADGD